MSEGRSSSLTRVLLWAAMLMSGTGLARAQFVWDGTTTLASVLGSNTVGSGITLSISTGNNHDFSATAIVNNGTVNWSGGQMRSGNSGTFTNNSIVNDSASSNWNNDFGNGALVFTNATGATYNKTASGTTTFVSPVVFNNSGTVNVTGGRLTLNGGGTSGGAFNVSGASVDLVINNGYTFTTGASLSGAVRATGGTLTASGNISVNGFSFEGGTLAGTQTFTGGPLTWSAGNWNSSGTTTIASDATLNITTAADHDFSAHAIVNNGIVNWQSGAGRLRSGNGGTFTNNATFNDAASNVWNNDLGNAVLVFTNAAGATYNKTAAGTTRFDVPFNNSGTVAITGGTFQLNGGGTLAATGVINAASGTSVIFSTDYTLANASSLTGAGAFSLTGGTLTATGTVNVSNFAIAGGTLTGTQTFNGGVSWTGGNLNSSGTMTIGSGSTFDISPSGGGAFDHDFSAHAIVNNGTVNWQSGAGRLRSGNSGTFTNNGTFNDASSFAMNNDFGNGVLVFTNSTGATYNKTTGASRFDVPFNNDGSIALTAGTLQFNGGGTNSASGAMSAASGATVLFSNSYTIADGSLLSGAGLYQATGGTFTINGNAGISNFQFSGGTLAGTHTLNGTIAWNGGNLNSSGTTTIGSGATFNISPSGASAFDHDFSARALVNNGTVNWQANAGRLRSGNSGSITNNGTWNDAASNAVNNDLGNGVLVFTNATAGTYNKTAAGTTRYDVPFNNDGHINVTGGTLQFNGGGTLSASGVINAATSTGVVFSNSYTLANASSLTGAGSFTVTGGTLSATGTVNVSNFSLAGGTLVGTQTFNGGLAWTGGNFNGGGTTTIAAGSTFDISPSGGVNAFDHDFSAHAFVNNGTVNWNANAGRLRSGNSGAFTNNGLFVDAASNAINNDYGNGVLVFTNSAGATYRKTAAGTTTFQVPLVNSGILDVQAGVLALTADSTFNNGSSQTGTGLLQLAAGLLTANGTITFSNFQFTGGTITGTHTFNGSVEWTSGNFNSGSSTTTLGGTTTIDGGADHDFSAHAFVNNGTVNWTAGAGRLRSGNGGTFTNNGTFNDAASNAWNNDYANALATFSNGARGIYNKTAAGTTTVGIAFNNGGTINAQVGSLDLAAGGSSPAGAVYNVSSGASLRFTGGSFTLADGAGFSGPGTAAIAGATVNIGGNVAAPVFALTGGTLAGTQSFLGAVTWSAGNMNASGTTTIAAGGSLTISSGADHDFSAHAIVNNGTVSWTGGRLRSGNGGTFTNNAIFNDTADNAWNNDYANAVLVFTNAAGATYNKNGAGTTTFLVPFNNGGTVNVTGGPLSLTAGGTISNGANYTGTGQALLSGGTFTASGTLTSTSLVLAGATLAGTHTLAGNINWANGNFNSGGTTTTIANGGALNITTGADHDFSAHAFVNNGTVNWQAGRLRSGNGGTFTNNSAFNDTASNVVNNDYANAVLVFTNSAGAFYNKTAAGQTSFQVPFVNSGTVTVSSGVLSLQAGGTINAGALFNGAGATSLAAGTFTASGLFTSANLSLDGATLAGNHSLGGVFTWNNGNFNSANTTTIPSGGVFNIATTADHDFSAHAFVNNGIVNWTGGRLRSGNGGTFLNAGIFNDTASNAVNNDYNNAVLTFTNNNTYNKTAAGTTTFQVPFINNNGLVSVSGGTLHFQSSFQQNAGTVAVSNNSTIQFDNGFALAAGILTGSGTIAGNVTSYGLITPGTGSTPGTLAISGNLTLMSSSALIFELGGIAPGTGYDFLTVTGSSALDGNLSITLVNGFPTTIQSTDTFTILSSSARTGVFANAPTSGVSRLNTLDLSGSFLINYTPTGVTLSNFVPVPEPSTYALLGLGLLTLAGFARRSRRG